MSSSVEPSLSEAIGKILACLERTAVDSCRLTGDIEWLRLRCDDTRRLRGELQLASARQLRSDLRALAREHPAFWEDPVLGAAAALLEQHLP